MADVKTVNKTEMPKLEMVLIRDKQYLRKLSQITPIATMEIARGEQSDN